MFLFPLSETIFAGIPATDLLGSLKPSINYRISTYSTTICYMNFSEKP